MATQEKTWNVANRLHSLKDSDNPEVNHIIAGADEIYDDAKGAKQSNINAQTDAALADRYTKAETYSKEQLDSLITTPDVNYVTVATFADLPQTGEANTIYRVSFYDGTQVDASKYALYAWNGSTYQLLAVRSAVGEVFDVSEYNSGATYETLVAALAAVPATSHRGGMSIKFIQLTPATYSVVKTEGLTEQPTGTELEAALAINDGTYTAAQLPVEAPATTATYWMAVTETVEGVETTTYTTWVITKVTSDSQEYVQYRLMSNDWSNVVTDWQGVDDTPTAGSRNLVESRGVADAIGRPTLYKKQSWTNVHGNATIGTLVMKAGHTYKATLTGTASNRYYKICSGKAGNTGTIYMNLSLPSGVTSVTKTYTAEEDITANIVIEGAWGTLHTITLEVLESNNNLLWSSEQNLNSEEKTQIWNNLGIKSLNHPAAGNNAFVTSDGIYPAFGVLFDLEQQTTEKPTWYITNVSEGIGTIKAYSSVWTIHYFRCYKNVKYKLVITGRESIYNDHVTIGVADHIVTQTEQIGVILHEVPNKVENTYIVESTIDGYMYIAHLVNCPIISLSTSSRIEKNEEDIALLSEDVQDLDNRTTELELYHKETPFENVLRKQYLDTRANGELYARAANFYAYYFLSEEGKTYKLVNNCSSANMSDRTTIGFCDNVPAAREVVSIVSRYIPIQGDNITMLKGNGKYICCTFWIERNTLTVYTIPKKEITFDHITVPAKLYAIKYNASGFNLLNRLYVEGIVNNNNDRDITISGAPSIFAEEDNPTTVGNKTIKAIVSLPDSYPYNMNITIQRVNPTLLQNKSIRIAHIGDSLTDQGVSCVSDFIIKCLNQDYGNISAVFVGTKNDNKTIKLGNYEFACNTYNQGTGGWAISDYLRKVVHVQYSGTTGGGGDSMPGKVAWDSLGLATKTRNGVQGRETRVDFVASIETSYEIRNACHGWYDADPSAELWDWIVNKRGITSFTYNGTQYTFGSSYSSADDATQIAAIKYMCSESWYAWNSNPFFDIDTVESSNGQYAFNYAKYLSRYKTLADDGVTRLVVGETAGTRVTNIESHDLCTPSHVCLVMSTNGGIEPADAEQTVDDLILCGNLIKEVDNNIKVIIGSPRPYGFCNSQLYTDSGCFKNYTFSQRMFNCNEVLKQKIAASGHLMIDLYAIQNPGGTFKRTAFDLLDGNEKIRDVGDLTHAGELIGYIDRAYQFVGAIISTL